MVLLSILLLVCWNSQWSSATGLKSEDLAEHLDFLPNRTQHVEDGGPGPFAFPNPSQALSESQEMFLPKGELDKLLQEIREIQEKIEIILEITRRRPEGELREATTEAHQLVASEPFGDVGEDGNFTFTPPERPRSAPQFLKIKP